jgi:DNA-binding NarL/FixJ family response regulator
MTDRPIRVFVVDDHELIRTGVEALVAEEEGMEMVGSADTAKDALRSIPDAHPDVVVLDMRLPDGDGVRICREIRSASPDVRCLIFTTYSDDQALMDSIMAGAAGYLLKETRGADLMSAIRRVAQGHSLIDPTVTSGLLDRLRGGSPEESEVQLTGQEERVLELIAEGRTNRQIGAAMGLAEKTVKNYVSNLLTKLGMESRTQAAIFAVRQGQSSSGLPGLRG